MTEPTRERTLADRVARGAALLDRTDPGWHDRVDLSKLAISHAPRCVLDQLEDAFLAAAEERVKTEGEPDWVPWAIALGFTALPTPAWDPAWAALDDLWIAEIALRGNSAPDVTSVQRWHRRRRTP